MTIYMSERLSLGCPKRRWSLVKTGRRAYNNNNNDNNNNNNNNNNKRPGKC